MVLRCSLKPGREAVNKETVSRALELLEKNNIAVDPLPALFFWSNGDRVIRLRFKRPRDGACVLLLMDELRYPRYRFGEDMNLPDCYEMFLSGEVVIATTDEIPFREYVRQLLALARDMTS